MKFFAITTPDEIESKLQTSLREGFVTFIYHHADPEHKLIRNKFLYVHTDEELVEKINLITADISVVDALMW